MQEIFNFGFEHTEFELTIKRLIGDVELVVDHAYEDLMRVCQVCLG